MIDIGFDQRCPFTVIHLTHDVRAHCGIPRISLTVSATSFSIQKLVTRMGGEITVWQCSHVWASPQWWQSTSTLVQTVHAAAKRQDSGIMWWILHPEGSSEQQGEWAGGRLRVGSNHLIEQVVCILDLGIGRRLKSILTKSSILEDEKEEKIEKKLWSSLIPTRSSLEDEEENIFIKTDWAKRWGFSQ